MKQLLRKMRSGFTLIELLVVVAIIGLLMAIAFPLLADAMAEAKRLETRTLMTKIRTGINDYKGEYFKYPPSLRADTSSPADVALLSDTNRIPETGSGAVWTNLYKTLAAIDEPAGYLDDKNKRRRTFIEIDTQYLNDPTDPVASVTFLDPFGYEFNIKVDSDYDKKIEQLPNKETGEANTFSIRDDIAIWSYGGDADVVEEYIVSWDNE